MSDATEDRVVEAMARAMAIADSDIEGEWPIYAPTALAQYRAYLAMQSVLMDLKPQEAATAPKAQEATMVLPRAFTPL